MLHPLKGYKLQHLTLLLAPTLPLTGTLGLVISSLRRIWTSLHSWLEVLVGGPVRTACPIERQHLRLCPQAKFPTRLNLRLRYLLELFLAPMSKYLTGPLPTLLFYVHAMFALVDISTSTLPIELPGLLLLS